MKRHQTPLSVTFLSPLVVLAIVLVPLPPSPSTVAHAQSRGNCLKTDMGCKNCDQSYDIYGCKNPFPYIGDPGYCDYTNQNPCNIYKHACGDEYE